MSLPAPLSDINAAIAMGLMSYGVIMSGGIASNGGRGILLTLKEFSLPISMSFRLFGALLSGLLVSELVYYTISLSSCCGACGRSVHDSARAHPDLRSHYADRQLLR